MLPNVDNQDLTCSQCKQSAFPLKVLILAALAAVRPLDVHDQNVVGHGRGPGRTGRALVFRQPYSLCRLLAGGLGHDAKVGLEQIVEQSRFAGRLRTENGDEVVVEAGLGHVCFAQVVIEIGTGER